MTSLSSFDGKRNWYLNADGPISIDVEHLESLLKLVKELLVSFGHLFWHNKVINLLV